MNLAYHPSFLVSRRTRRLRVVLLDDCDLTGCGHGWSWKGSCGSSGDRKSFLRPPLDADAIAEAIIHSSTTTTAATTAHCSPIAVAWTRSGRRPFATDIRQLFLVPCLQLRIALDLMHVVAVREEDSLAEGEA